MLKMRLNKKFKKTAVPFGTAVKIVIETQRKKRIIFVFHDK
jgi:hypothetical protein